MEHHIIAIQLPRRTTKLIPGLRNLIYEERLKERRLTTLETRRLRGQIHVEVFKMVMKILITILFN